MENDESYTGSDIDDEEMVTQIPVDDHGFETLAQDFKEVLAELAQDKAMDAFRGEYEKLFGALEKSHNNEKRLNTKCQELQSEIASQEARVDAAHDKSVEDQDTIGSLKKEIEKAWKMVDMTQEREERARETIETLNTEIQTLTKIIEEKTVGAEDTNINELRKLRDELTTQRDNLKSEVGDLRGKIAKVNDELKEMKEEKAKVESNLANTKQELQGRTNEMNREIRRRERADREVKQLKGEIETKQTEAEALEAEKEGIRANVVKLEKALNDQRNITQDLTQKIEEFKERVTKLQQENEQQVLSMQSLEHDADQKEQDLRVKEGEVTALKNQINRNQKELDDLKRKLEDASRMKIDLENEKVKLKKDFLEQKKMLGVLQHQNLVEKKTHEQMKHVSNVLEQNLKRTNNTLYKQTKTNQESDKINMDLKRQISTLEGTIERQRRFISSLEEERDRYINEANDLAKKVDDLLEDVRDAESLAFTYKKDLTEMETRLKQQHNGKCPKIPEFSLTACSPERS